MPHSDDESSDEKMDAHEENDTSVDSKSLLCATHLGKLADVIEKTGDRAPLKSILECRLDDGSDIQSVTSHWLLRSM